LARQGSAGDCLFLLEEGTLVVVRRVPGDVEERVDTLLPGAIFGEMALLDHGVRSATLRTLDHSRVCRVSRRAFESLVLDGGSAGIDVLRAILRSLEERLASARAALRVCVAQSDGSSANCVALPWQPWAGEPSVLTTLPALAWLDEMGLRALQPALEWVELAADTRITSTATDTHLLWLLSGALTLEHLGGVGLPVTGPGQFLDGRPVCGTRSASLHWRARSRVQLLRMPIPWLSEQPAAAPALLMALARCRAELLRRTTGRLMHAWISTPDTSH
jgi:hypothetical protein